MSNESLGSSESSTADVGRSQNLILGAVWAIVVAVAGGYGCGLVVAKFGLLGTISLWALGAFAGAIGRKIIGSSCRPIGWMLVVACVVAYFIAELFWVRWNTVQGQEGWMAAMQMMPTFFEEYSQSAFVGGIFAVFGAMSAYRQTAVRYRWVQVE